MADSNDQVVPNSEFTAWQRTDKLFKGWNIGTLILRQVVGLHTAHDVWKALKSTFNKATMDHELTLSSSIRSYKKGEL